MHLRSLIISIGVVSAIMWIGWLFLLFATDPFAAGFFTFLSFYASLYIALMGTLALISLGVRIYFFKRTLVIRLVRISFRQAFWLSSLFLGVLILQGQRLLTWWNIPLLILALVLLEFFFLSLRRQTRKRPAVESGATIGEDDGPQFGRREI